ncbi:cysteine--tRNA ligase [Amylibacter kogurei]|uniref:Cysteine--tRNA ligase n=1 Tax=Paramylibacter kogurei TaxID=1889778 RepID=A0A2G5K623_9RHOB|nr:cysteine--tRNA ligase [Amylibacter kogurei]PIB24997.1 cysteine--tRNA ligase [Amylibacter kogurei]
MTTIKLHNSKTRKKEEFKPLDEKNVRMYVCGPTVYDRAHLGNARPVVVFDTLFRLLRHVYGDDHVTYARNFTDVDDKINAKAAETGRSIRDITDETIQWYLDDMGALGAMEPTLAPRATEYISQMVDMIGELIEKGHAYAAEGHVLFAVDSWKEHYGKLSGRSVDDMIAGARVEVAPYKRNPMDFVLWKPSDGDTPGWESPWGYGRPGWHIECSAMARELFGEKFDIHGGGLDLQFPHHENEIAQSCACCGTDSFAQYWMHNEMLQVEGKKMSKSLGNFFTVRDLLDQGYSGEVIRFVMLSTHYSKPMDWTDKKAKEAEATLRKWTKIAAHAEDGQQPYSGVIDALANDLNTAGAIAAMHGLVKDKNAGALRASMDFLGFSTDQDIEATMLPPEVEAMVNSLLDEQREARKQKNWERADYIRDSLGEAGIAVDPASDGTKWGRSQHFDLEKLESIK